MIKKEDFKDYNPTTAIASEVKTYNGKRKDKVLKLQNTLVPPQILFKVVIEGATEYYGKDLDKVIEIYDKG